MMINKKQIREMMRELNRHMQTIELNTKEGNETFKELHIRYNDLCEIFYS